MTDLSYEPGDPKSEGYSNELADRADDMRIAEREGTQ